MNNTEAYSYLFTDSLMGSLLLPPHNELVFGAMQIFGGYNALLMILLAISGSMTGLALNFGFGKLLLTCKNQEWFIERSALLDKASLMFKRYGLWLLLCSFVPVLGGIVTLLAGVMRVRFALFLLLVGAGQTAYYIYLTQA
jgi:membrane protein YqaA with SNARE-associated domain